MSLVEVVDREKKKDTKKDNWYCFSCLFRFWTDYFLFVDRTRAFGFSFCH